MTFPTEPQLFPGGDLAPADAKTYFQQWLSTIRSLLGDGSTKAVARATLGVPIQGFLYGMTLSNNGSDATNDIDIAAGQCSNSTGAVLMTGGAMTKRLDAAWAAGTGNGGRMSAAAIANTTYHVFAIYKDSDGSVDYGFDTSATAPTMPSGYTYFRRIGSIMRASNAIRPFTQLGNEFLLTTPVASYSQANPGSSAVTVTLDVPTGIKVWAKVRTRVYDSVNIYAAVYTSLDTNDAAPSTTASPGIDSANSTTVSGASGAASLDLRTNTSAQIRARLSGSAGTTNLTVITVGWKDPRL